MSFRIPEGKTFVFVTLLCFDVPFQDDASTEEMEAAFNTEQEDLRLMQLGLTRLAQIYERGWFHMLHAINIKKPFQIYDELKKLSRTHQVRKIRSY